MAALECGVQSSIIVLIITFNPFYPQSPHDVLVAEIDNYITKEIELWAGFCSLLYHNCSSFLQPRVDSLALTVPFGYLEIWYRRETLMQNASESECLSSLLLAQVAAPLKIIFIVLSRIRRKEYLLVYRYYSQFILIPLNTCMTFREHVFVSIWRRRGAPQ